ncbi:MAG: hypothetical protein DRN68_09640, partial [Thaumarchaeota archaeon]
PSLDRPSVVVPPFWVVFPKGTHRWPLCQVATTFTPRPGTSPAIGIETHTKKEEVIEGTALPTVETRSYVMIFDTKKWQRRYLFVGRFPGIPGIELESVSLTSLSFSPDGSLLACGWEWEVILLDPITGKQLHILSGHSREVNSVAFSPDERLLASGSSDKTIKLWNVETGKCIRTLTGHADSVYSVAFSPDGRYLASGSWDKTIKLWDVGTGECIRTLEGHKGYVFSVTFSPDGRYLASGSYDGTVLIWDVEAILHPNKPPIAKFKLATARTPKSTKPVEFNASNSYDPDGRITKYEWDWDSDGTFDLTTSSPLAEYRFPPGTHTVTLRVTDNKGATSRATLRIEVVEPKPPVADFSFSPEVPNALEEVRFEDRSHDPDGSIVSWEWDFGDGTTSKEREPVHRYEGWGRYRVVLRVRDEDGLEDEVEREVLVKGPPVSSFVVYRIPVAGVREEVGSTREVRRIEVIQKVLLEFDATGSHDPDGEIEKYEWDWESDGTFDLSTREPIAYKRYEEPGTYEVTLRVTDDRGATSTARMTVVVGEKAPPVADFSFSPSKPTVLVDVEFTDNSHDPDGKIVSRQWDFGDGTTSTERNPTHRYTKKGSFTVKLTVTDDDGLKHTKEVEIQVVNLPPEATFTFEPEEPYAGQEVSFDASGSGDPDGEIVEYAWDFDGDGVTDAEGIEVFHTFAEPGTYTVKLTVTDDDGATASYEEELQIRELPPGPAEVEEAWALVVGISDYRDEDIADLDYPEEDAKAFRDFLIDPRYGGFPGDHVRLLLGEEATLIALRDGLSWLAEAGEEDLVVFFFAGHGTFEQDRNEDEPDGFDEYLVVYDTDYDRIPSTAMCDDELWYWLS